MKRLHFSPKTIPWDIFRVCRRPPQIQNLHKRLSRDRKNPQHKEQNWESNKVSLCEHAPRAKSRCQISWLARKFVVKFSVTNVKGLYLRNPEKGDFLKGFLKECTPLLAKSLWVPHVLLGPISLGSFCLGGDTGFCRNPFAKPPFSWFLIHTLGNIDWKFATKKTSHFSHAQKLKFHHHELLGPLERYENSFFFCESIRANRFDSRCESPGHLR